MAGIIKWGVTLIVLLTFFASTGFKKFDAEQSVAGADLYKQNCVRCHGTDGTKGRFGAKNLATSHLPDLEIIQRVQNGKGFMPPFKKKFTPDEIKEIVLYIKSLRNN